MKKVLVICLALVMILALAACGSTPSSSAAPAEGSVKGTVADATMNTLTLQAPNGQEYIFGTEGAEISSPEGLLVGDEVTVHYTGTLDESKTQQDVTVTEIFVDSEADPNPPAASSPAPSSQPAAPPPAASTGDVKSFEGVIDKYDGDTMIVADATGVDYLFPLDGADLHVGSEGFKEGDNVIVYYYGELVESPNLQNVQVGEVKKADQ